MPGHNENLRFDRRLARRRGWISEKELARHTEALPDVADKAEWVDSLGESADAGDESAADAAQAGATPEEAAPQAPGA